VEQNNSVVLTHEVRVELILLLFYQPLLNVDQTYVELLEIKRKYNKTADNATSFNFLKRIKRW
jgi:hypothetical protein